jgi:hypothetical protein
MVTMHICYACGSTKTYTCVKSNGYHNQYWYLNHDIDNNVFCSNCYDKYWRSKESKQKIWRKSNPKHMFFLGLSIYLSWDPRKHVCLECGKIGRTELHHWFYLIIMPWACTTELCVSCHDKTKDMKRDPVTGRFTNHL